VFEPLIFLLFVKIATIVRGLLIPSGGHGLFVSIEYSRVTYSGEESSHDQVNIHFRHVFVSAGHGLCDGSDLCATGRRQEERFTRIAASATE
jgi:hypothetical protein